MIKTTIKVEEEVKDRFKANCEMEGTNMSVEIRKFMRRYNRARKNERIRINKHQQRRAR